MQDAGPLLQRHLAPRAIQGRFRSLDGGIHLLPAGFVNLADQQAVSRIDVVEELAAGRPNVLSVDVVFYVFHCCSFP